MSYNNNVINTNISRRTALKTIGGAAAAAAACSVLPKTAFANQHRPNILFILTDDHRWDAMSCMNHPFIKTPNLDRIFEEGVLFENAFVTTSLCSPSRASFLTGQYPHTHGVTTNHTPWNTDNSTFFKWTREKGYENAFIGKWHMPGEELPTPNQLDLDLFISFTKEGGQGVYHDCPLVIQDRNGKEELEREGKYITEDLTDFALEFIEKPRSNPFCLYLSHKAIHFGFRPPDHLKGTLDGVDLNLPPESDTFNTFTNNHLFVGAPFPMNMLYQGYCETILSVDEQIGRILDKLEHMGILDDTIVIYAGDNGHFWGEHGLYDKRWAYEESIRIPFLMRYPKRFKEQAKRVNEIVLNIDLAPTLIDLISDEMPEDADNQFQGRSILDLFPEDRSDANAEWRHSFLYEHFPVFPIPIPGITAIRTDTHKYIEYQNNVQDPELFNLADDPREMNNLYYQEEDTAQSLKNQLEQLKEETGYRFISGFEETISQSDKNATLTAAIGVAAIAAGTAGYKIIRKGNKSEDI